MNRKTFAALMAASTFVAIAFTLDGIVGIVLGVVCAVAAWFTWK